MEYQEKARGGLRAVLTTARFNVTKHTCPDHNVDFVQIREGNWKCPVPNCSKGMIELHFTGNQVNIQVKSAEMVDGQPQREFGGTAADGVRTHRRILRSDGGRTVSRSLVSLGPFEKRQGRRRKKGR